MTAIAYLFEGLTQMQNIHLLNQLKAIPSPEIYLDFEGSMSVPDETSFAEILHNAVTQCNFVESALDFPNGRIRIENHDELILNCSVEINMSDLVSYLDRIGEFMKENNIGLQNNKTKMAISFFECSRLVHSLISN